jgi:biotin transport system substrate-specific component
MYLGIGAAGVPWFTGLNSGIGYLAGPTGGYIIGFVLAAFFIGYIVDKYINFRKLFSMIMLMLFSTFILIYIPGLIQFYIWTGGTIGLMELFTLCVIPFIAADFIKAVIAAGIANIITPKKAYGPEPNVK